MEPANTPPFPIALFHSPDAPTPDDALGTPVVTGTNVAVGCDDTAGDIEEAGRPAVNLCTDDITGTGHADDATVTGIDDASVVTEGTDDTNVAGTDDTYVAGKDAANIAEAELMNAVPGADDVIGSGFTLEDDKYAAEGADDTGAVGKGFTVDDGKKLPEDWNVGQQVTGGCWRTGGEGDGEDRFGHAWGGNVPPGAAQTLFTGWANMGTGGCGNRKSSSNSGG